MKKTAAILLSIGLSVGMALAYIDPGTGGLIAGSLWPLILGILGAIGGFFAKYLFKPIKRGVRRVWKKKV